MKEAKKEEWRRRFWESVTRRLLRAPIDIPVYLGSKMQNSTMFVAVRSFSIWRAEPKVRKLKSLISFRWEPDDELIQKIAHGVFLHEVFGAEQDFGPQLFRLLNWHSSREWDFSCLTEEDLKRADALQGFAVLTRIRLGNFRFEPSLNLRLAARQPFLPIVAIAMVAKIPVISFQLFLDVHVIFAFSSIRRSKHENADSLIAYLYELLFIQQKIAIALNEFAHRWLYSSGEKRDAALINEEVEAIMRADLIFAYLKASLEKTVALAGLIYGIKDLDSKKNHRAKYAALLRSIPKVSTETPYGEFFMEYVKSENLEELNSYRSGLLHKKGVADLQPHSYFSAAQESMPFGKIFSVLHEQHAKNTAVLFCVLALLTDKLVEIDPADFLEEDMSDLYRVTNLSKYLQKVFEQDAIE